MFFNWFSTIEIECDAPVYPIVRACRLLGFRTPEDVRWYRVSGTQRPQSTRIGWIGFKFMRSFFGKVAPKSPTCICGHPSPKTKTYAFTLFTGAKVRLMLGQCERCKTISWRERS
jgi:hypothetical protein